MTVAARPAPLRFLAARPTLPLTQALRYDVTWLGYEAALPWIRITPPLARVPVRASVRTR